MKTSDGQWVFVEIESFESWGSAFIFGKPDLSRGRMYLCF